MTPMTMEQCPKSLQELFNDLREASGSEWNLVLLGKHKNTGNLFVSGGSSRGENPAPESLKKSVRHVILGYGEEPPDEDFEDEWSEEEIEEDESTLFV